MQQRFREKRDPCQWESEWSCSVVSNSLQCHGLPTMVEQPTRLLHPWNFPGKSTGVGCYFLLIFLTQGSNPGLPHCWQTLYHMSHKGSPCQRGRLKTILSGSRWVGKGWEHPKSRGCMSYLRQGFRARHTSQLPVEEEWQPHTWFLIINSVRDLYNSCSYI